MELNSIFTWSEGGSRPGAEEDEAEEGAAGAPLPAGVARGTAGKPPDRRRWWRGLCTDSRPGEDEEAVRVAVLVSMEIFSDGGPAAAAAAPALAGAELAMAGVAVAAACRVSCGGVL